MARKKKGRRRTKKTGISFGWGLVIIVVAVSMAFIGYKVGQVAIRSVTRPLVAQDNNSRTSDDTDAVPASERTPVASQTPSDAAKPATPTPTPTAPDATPGRTSSGAEGETVAAEPELWRVRVGSFAVREEAEAALQDLRDFVPEAFVVRDGVYRLQAGAFAERDRAEALADDLAKRGLAPEMIAPKNAKP